MSVLVHFRDGSADVSVASGIKVDPYISGTLVDNNLLVVSNSSEPVAVFPEEIVKYMEIFPPS